MAGFHEADMIDLTDQEARQKLLNKIDRVVANLGAEAGERPSRRKDSGGGEGPEARESGEKQIVDLGVGASA